MKYTVTGATGNLGQLVVDQLLADVTPSDVRATIHNPKKASLFEQKGIETRTIDYADVTSMVDAFQGTDVLVYIPSNIYNVLQAVSEFEKTLQAVQTTGIKNMVYVGFYADQERNPFVMSSYFWYVPRRLASTDLHFAVLKNAMYADPLVPYLPELIERGAIIYPVGQAPLSYISRNDSAEAIATVATTPALRNNGQLYTLTQPESYDMDTLATIMSDITGAKIGYAPMTLSAFIEAYRAEGDGVELGSMYHAGNLGLLSTVTDDFKQITGHDAQPMPSFLKAHYQK
ncbi:NmrA family NAD(P)-binding protein [Secundilactobacillus paracollinoides]|uniref:NmrA family NAD(P)-binding protein n=1 Tax=Secundilactobacillus paracollinoides TaxID=240427 RepID=UPI0006D2B6FC|nr:NAD(P)H-binding protein [Secundilactobacillus paracollinoides]KRL79290.1 3-beta hydroxysteroid dehydrogenase isomerase [Secundilactobacillus paracollinoides DSM 15502 = JCM 11969]